MSATLALTLAYPALSETTSSDPTAETYSQLVTSSNATATVAISNALKFAASKSVRTSTVILATFNALAALATALGIIHSCRQYRKKAQRRLSEPPSGLFYIQTVEVFPLILSSGIVVQSVVFAGAQAAGLQALLSSGCTIAAIFVLPALFLIPFTHLVFGIETAARGIRWQFAPRGKWNVSKCLGAVAVMTLVALIVAAASPANNFCFASLFWFLQHYAAGCFGVFVAITIIQLAVIVTIFIQLNMSHMVDAVEKTAASRMIFYLTLGFISNAFVIPFFFSLTFLDQEVVIYMSLDFSMAASVVVNVNGLMVTGLHLFLKSQANSQLIQGAEANFEQKKSFYDRRDSWSSEYSLQSIKVFHDQVRDRTDSIVTLLHAAEGEGTMQSFSAKQFGTLSGEPVSPKDVSSSEIQLPQPIQLPSESSPSQLRKQQMSFYHPNSSAAPEMLPATTYTPISPKRPVDSLVAAPIKKPWTGRGHRRSSSTATVQIGIRISNMGAILASGKNATDFADVPMLVPDDPQLQTEPDTEVGSGYVPEDIGRFVLLDDSPRRRSQWETRLKTLPPTPLAPAAKVTQQSGAEQAKSKAQVSAIDTSDVQLVTLSPAVYTPVGELPRRNPSSKPSRRLPSLNGAAYNTPIGRSNSAASSPANSPPSSPPRSASGAATTPLPNHKTDWI